MEALTLLILVGLFLWWRSSRKSRGPRNPPPAAAGRMSGTKQGAARPQPPPAPRRPAPPGGGTARHLPPQRTGSDGAPSKKAVAESERCWVPMGTPVQVAGYTLPGGVYVGRSLPALTYGTDPALIVDKAKVDRNRPDAAGNSMSYWPSYSDVSPQARAAYLTWLAAGRPAGAYIGYVFLWFYGVERRVFIDAPASPNAAAEVPALVAEVERLLELYRDNGSFRSYATDFLAAARLISGAADTDAIVPPRQRSGWDLPIDVKLVLGDLIADGKPIPAEWALAWVVCHPEVRLRTPASRCVDEFAELFIARYRARHGDGIVVRPNKTRLRLEYRPASASFGGSISLSVGDLPDVSRLSAPVTKKLVPIAEQAVDDLDAYSRHLGRGGTADDLNALALLPPELSSSQPAARTFLDGIDGRLGGRDQAVVPSGELVAAWPSAATDKLSKKEASALARLLASSGLGVEPDVRFGGANLSRVEQAVLFRLPEGTDDDITDRFTAATVLLHVAAAVATADGTVTEDEERLLEAHLEEALHLGHAERIRLRAHLAWLLAEHPSLAGLKKRLEVLGEPQRHQLGRFLIGVAGADGHVDRDELKVLAKLYPMLGLDADDVYTDVHALTSGSVGSGPVQVLPAEPDTSHAIPAPPAEQPAGTVTLAPDKVAAIMAETAAVAATLGAVFDDPDTPPEPEEPEPADEPDSDMATIAGLDEVHSTLLVRLAERPMWSRAEFNELAAALGLMPAGAIETVNEASFSACDEPILEGDDPIEINSYAVEELLP